MGRIFIAVAVTDDVRHGLSAHLEAALGDRPMPGRPVVARNWHLTLRFIGKVDDLGYDKLLHHLGEAALGAPFVMGFGGLGAFPRPQRATVLWLGIERGRNELEQLAAAVEEAVGDAGFLAEERPFHPHLTLSRIRPHQDVRATIDDVPAFPGSQRVEDIVVYRSHLRGGPPDYEVMERITLQ